MVTDQTEDQTTVSITCSPCRLDVFLLSLRQHHSHSPPTPCHDSDISWPTLPAFQCYSRVTPALGLQRLAYHHTSVLIRAIQRTPATKYHHHNPGRIVLQSRIQERR